MSPFSSVQWWAGLERYPFQVLREPCGGVTARRWLDVRFFAPLKSMPINRAASDALAKDISGASLVVVSGADHAIPIGWAKELNEAVLTFLVPR